MEHYNLESLPNLTKTLERVMGQGRMSEKRFVWEILNYQPASQRRGFADVYHGRDAIIAYAKSTFSALGEMGISADNYVGVLLDLTRDGFRAAQTPICTIDEVRKVLDVANRVFPSYREIFHAGTLRILLLDGQSRFCDGESEAYFENEWFKAEIRLYRLCEEQAGAIKSSQVLIHELENILRIYLADGTDTLARLKTYIDIFSGNNITDKAFWQSTPNTRQKC